jgi:hypothetical protein
MSGTTLGNNKAWALRRRKYGATGMGKQAPLLHKKHRAEYISWSSMKTRCSNPEFKDWNLYGGRGIAVCERWLTFPNFLADMGLRPSARHSIDRIDSDGNYEPGNCRWATAKEQANNWATRNRRYTLNGKTLTAAEWSDQIGITSSSLRERIERWGLEKALTTPPVRSRQRNDDGSFASG